MKLKVFWFCFFILFFSDIRAYAEENSKAEKLAVQYLNSISSFRADFTQNNQDGSTATGHVLILKPQKMKWYYNYPTSITVQINGKRVIYYDRELDEYTYSILDGGIYTLLSYKDFNDVRNIKFLALLDYKKEVWIKLYDTVLKQNIELFFNKKPVFISRIKLINDVGDITDIKFSNVDYNGVIDDKEFAINIDHDQKEYYETLN